ncbi:MAG TPA: hypothetical protein VK910_09145 [Thiobacillus sp.]|nr:hypothetical protein [Thiobacillus sp.]
MKVSNVVISTVFAISAAGGLGLAYAQSTYSEPPPGTSAPTTQDATPTRQDAAPGTMDPAPSGTARQDSRTMGQDPTGSTETTRSDYTERVARADRN